VGAFARLCWQEGRGTPADQKNPPQPFLLGKERGGSSGEWGKKSDKHDVVSTRGTRTTSDENPEHPPMQKERKDRNRKNQKEISEGICRSAQTQRHDLLPPTLKHEYERQAFFKVRRKGAQPFKEKGEKPFFGDMTAGDRTEGGNTKSCKQKGRANLEPRVKVMGPKEWAVFPRRGGYRAKGAQEVSRRAEKRRGKSQLARSSLEP